MNISHRQVNKRVRFTDVSGNPLAGKDIKVKQTAHKFLFGCGGFDFMPYVIDGNEFFKDITEKWLEIFNYATLPFYWGNFEPEEGKPDTENLLKTAKYLQSKGVKVKGHPLCWHTVCADWLLKYDNKAIMEKQLGRIDREVTGFKGVIDMWDVINEVVIMPVFDKYDNAVTRLCNEKGRVGLVKEVFDEARKCNPDAVLLLNDFNTSPKYEELIEECLEAGVPISAIGIQSHQHQGYWGAEKLNDVLERFGRFGLPIHFTENTLISGDLMAPHIVDLNDWQVDDWPSTEEGEARQCKEVEEMYRILFAHPLVEAITTWDFKDGAWLNAPSGFIRRDKTTKPSYDMLKKLIKDEWFTDTTVKTDADGWALVNAFKGTYSIEAEGKNATAEFIDDTEAVIAL
ncbi:MAG: endo-1,4-beta-xylanase [Lachnospiraceae bacterium]|nr:endo-1,4-beta-xylanase [Lachnospiraceae bacterium]